MDRSCAEVRAGVLRRSVRHRRCNDRHNVVNFITTAAAVSIANHMPTVNATATTQVPIEFLQQREAIPVPTKRRRQKHLDSLNAPLQIKRLALGKAMMKRDRLLQQKWVRNGQQHVENNNKVQAMLQEVNETIDALQQNDMEEPTSAEVLFCNLVLIILLQYMCCSQVYEVLDEEFAQCPWPVPPSSILLHLPFKERRGKKLTREAVMCEVVSKDHKWHNWEFREINPRVRET